MKKNHKKIAKKKSKEKIQSTLDFLDVSAVHDTTLVLQRKKKVEYVKGIKITPKSFFLESKAEQTIIIHRLRVALNRLLFPVWHAFVFNPINLDKQYANLIRKRNAESDQVIIDMIDDDLEKIELFIDNYRELEFFMIVKDASEKTIMDQFYKLKTSISNAGFEVKELNKIDFNNYLAYVFENPLANDFYFSRGVFSDDMNQKLQELASEESEV